MGLKIHLKLLHHINLYKIVNKHSFKRNFSDKILPATNYFTWDTANTVQLRMEKTVPGNYPPIRLGASPNYNYHNSIYRQFLGTFIMQYDFIQHNSNMNSYCDFNFN